MERSGAIIGYKKKLTDDWLPFPQEYLHTSASGVFLYAEFIPEDLDGVGNNYSGNLYLLQALRVCDIFTNICYSLPDEILIYSIVPCSPQLVGLPTLVQNQCSNGSSGSATFTFNRPLTNEEYFNMTIYQENGVNDILVSSQKITQSQIVNQKFECLGLSPAIYYLRYQTFLGNGTAIASAEDSDPFTITAPSAVTFSTTSQNILCGGADTGSITVIPSGGNGSYQYSKDNGSNWQDSTVFSGLTASTYPILVKDTNACIAPLGAQSVTLTPITPTITFGNVEINSPSLIGGNDGNIAVTVSGGTPLFTYHWTNSSNLSVGTNSNSLTGLTAGTYTLNLSDTNSCPKSESFIVTEFTATITEIEGVDCLGGSIGKLKAQITGGKPPYDYEWVGKNDFDDQLDNIPEGNYTLKVMDYNGLVRETTYVLEPHLPTATAIPTAVLCKGLPTGSIDITASSGRPPYNYNWVKTTAPTVSLTTAEDPTNLVAGNYNCTITDAHSCTFTLENISVMEPSLALAITDPPTLTLVTLIGASTGGIDIAVTGGTTGYTYLWSTGETTPGISNKPAGTYTVTVTDANQCTTAASYTLEDPPPLVVTVSVEQPILCNNAENGILKANVSGGRPPYTYQWKKDTELIPSATQQIEHLSPGNYEVKVTDTYGANLSSSILNVTEPAPLSATPHITPIDCYGQANGTIALNAFGGTPPYTYAWNTGATTAILTNLGVGNYVVEITDAHVCRELITGIHVNSTSSIVIHENTKNPSCHGNCDGEISINITGGSGNYSVVWDTPQASGWNATQLCKGMYHATVTDIADNCMIPLTFTMTEPEQLTLDLGTDQTICYGQQLTIGEDKGVSGYQYQWTSDTGFSAAIPQVVVTESGTYQLSITTPKGCSVADAIAVHRLDAPVPSEFLVVSQTYKNEDIILINLSQKPNETYEWVIPSHAIIQSQTPGNSVIRFTATGSYTLRLKTTNTLDGCQFFVDKQIIVEENPKLSAIDASTSLIQEFAVYPNPTPNGGLFNVKVELNQEAPLSLTIYDMALGKLIIETNLPTAKDHLQEYNLNLTTGVYWIILRTSNTVQAKKLIVK